jgi:predicted AAA+ superfamily ATPase
MRKFSSYGPVDADLHYYVPRQELIDRAYTQLVGEDPVEGGHYITVWAPRQRGKTWIMQQVVRKVKERGDFERTLFREPGQPYAPFEDLGDTITEMALYVKPLLRRYEAIYQDAATGVTVTPVFVETG